MKHAKALIREVRMTYPSLTMSGSVAANATLALRREPTHAELLVEPAGRTPRGMFGTSRYARAQCAVITVTGDGADISSS